MPEQLGQTLKTQFAERRRAERGVQIAAINMAQPETNQAFWEGALRQRQDITQERVAVHHKYLMDNYAAIQEMAVADATAVGYQPEGRS